VIPKFCDSHILGMRFPYFGNHVSGIVASSLAVRLCLPIVKCISLTVSDPCLAAGVSSLELSRFLLPMKHAYGLPGQLT
jgi:hypothetical protein